VQQERRPDPEEGYKGLINKKGKEKRDKKEGKEGGKKKTLNFSKRIGTLLMLKKSSGDRSGTGN